MFDQQTLDYFKPFFDLGTHNLLYEGNIKEDYAMSLKVEYETHMKDNLVESLNELNIVTDVQTS